MGVKYCLKVLKIEHLRRPELAFVKIVNKKLENRKKGVVGFTSEWKVVMTARN